MLYFMSETHFGAHQPRNNLMGTSSQQTSLHREAILTSRERLDEETAEVLGELMGVKNFMENRERYREEDKYNMCQALKELMDDSRKEGKAEGKAEGERQLAVLMQSLFADGRIEDARLAAEDEKIRKNLYSEYGLK